MVESELEHITAEATVTFFTKICDAVDMQEVNIIAIYR